MLHSFEVTGNLLYFSVNSLNISSLCVVLIEGQGERGGVKLSRHSTGRLISIKNISKWRESSEVSSPALPAQKSTKGTRGLIKLSTHTHFHRHILCTLDIDNPFAVKKRRGKENKGGCTPLLCCFSYNLTSNPLYGTRKFFV